MPQPSTLPPYQIGACSAGHFEAVKQHIQVMELDDRQLKRDQFLTATRDGILLGFGRVREYEHLSEMCSLGILPAQRTNGLGKALTAQMIKKAKHASIYLVCIIPSYFEEFGFRITDTYPPEMEDKLNYCIGSLAVPEPYCVMQHNRV